MRVRLLGPGLLALALSGCFSPVGTARTLPPGSVQLHAAVGSLNLLPGRKVCYQAGPCLEPPEPVSTIAGGLRAGLADGVELGLGLQPPGLAADVKVALWRGSRFALAVDPTLVPMFAPLETGVAAAVPILVDVDFAPNATLVTVITPGQAFVENRDPPPPFLGLGAGLHVRTSEEFAIQPGLQWLYGDDDWSVLTIGLGLVFGPPPDRPPVRSRWTAEPPPRR